jgi:adenosine deaminase
MNLHEFLRAIPKISLHCHLEGSVQAQTVRELAAKHGASLPPCREPGDLYDYPDILKFLEVYNLVASVVRDADDFHRITYEALEEAHAHGVRYREMFWSPVAHMEIGVPYRTAIDGIVAGIRDAAKNFGIQCRLIADINRMKPPEAGLEMLETVLAHRRDEVIGMGLDYAETGHPPEQFWKAFRQASAAGLHLTAHACEEGPPRNVETCLDLLGCERIDHGYHVIEDERITARCAAAGVVFNCTPVSTAWVYFGSDFSRHPIRRMVASGLKITVDCDDPPMFKTDPTRDYLVMADHMEFGPEDFREFLGNAIDGCWLDDPAKRRMRRELLQEFDLLAAQITDCGGQHSFSTAC